MPNYVIDIYKARRSKYKNVKIWSFVDLGTCRVEDLFITDGYYNPITDFEILKYEKKSSTSFKQEEKKEPEELKKPVKSVKYRLEDF